MRKRLRSLFCVAGCIAASRALRSDRHCADSSPSNTNYSFSRFSKCRYTLPLPRLAISAPANTRSFDIIALHIVKRMLLALAMI